MEKLLSNCSAAAYLGLSAATLAKLRCVGGSPSFLKLGRRVLYERAALDSWLAGRRAKSTSDAARLPRRLTDELPPAA
jgi:predicted DNA-binding transcriptional regulator AlpA